MIKFPSLLHWLAVAVLVILASATAACSGLGYEIVAISGTSTPPAEPTSSPASLTETPTKIALRTTGTASVTSSPSPGTTSSPPSVTATQTKIALPATDTPPVAPETVVSAADFTLSDLDGEEVTLSDLRGQMVLLNFWATW
jgi:hypothetical protein